MGPFRKTPDMNIGVSAAAVPEMVPLSLILNFAFASAT